MGCGGSRDSSTVHPLTSNTNGTVQIQPAQVGESMEMEGGPGHSTVPPLINMKQIQEEKRQSKGKGRSVGGGSMTPIGQGLMNTLPTETEKSKSANRLSLRSSQSRSQPKHFTFRGALNVGLNGARSPTPDSSKVDLEDDAKQSAKPKLQQQKSGSRNSGPPTKNSRPASLPLQERKPTMPKNQLSLSQQRVVMKQPSATELNSSGSSSSDSSQSSGVSPVFQLRVNYVYKNQLNCFYLDGCDENMLSSELRERCIQGHRRLKMTEEEGSAAQSPTWPGKIWLVHNGQNMVPTNRLSFYGLVHNLPVQEQVTLIFSAS